MPQSKSKYQFFQEASLSQKLAFNDKEYSHYAGADPKTSLKIMFFEILGKHKKIDLEKGDMPLFMDLLHGRRKVLFATSEKVNEITKMGLQMPKAEYEYFGDDEDT